MHKIFAIDPELIGSFSDARFVLGMMGFSKGALIGELPRKWERNVLQKSKEVDKRRSELVALLQKCRSEKIFIKSCLSFNGEVSWINNALDNKDIDFVISADTNFNSKKLLNIEDIHKKEISEFFDGLRSFFPRRSAVALAGCSEYLVRNSSEYVVFIDPYFSGSNGQIRVIEKILSYASDYISRNVVIHAFSGSEKRPANAWAVKEVYSKCFSDLVKQGWSFDVYFWDKQDADRHPRYLITDIGCLFYDRGFNEPNDLDERKQTTKVSCEPEFERLKMLEEYSASIYKGEFVRVDRNGARLVTANAE